MIDIIKKKVLEWCLDRKSVCIEDLYNSVESKEISVYDDRALKFIGQSDLASMYIGTPSGLYPVSRVLKTVEYEVYEVLLANGMRLECADRHILIDSFNRQLYAKDSLGEVLTTVNGHSRVVGLNKLEYSESMYDISIDGNDHTYFTNGFLSHNTTLAAAYFLWYTSFQEDKTVLIVSNNMGNASEFIHRVRGMYEELPMFIKPGVTRDGWNKTSVGFDTRSRIISRATSESSARGLSLSLVFADELAFIRESVANDFWTSLSPVLSTGGSMVIASTPNGDSNLFARLALGSQLGTNEFKFLKYIWSDVPGRDEVWKASEISRIGELKFRQEHECCHGDTIVTIKNINSWKIEEILISRLYENIGEHGNFLYEVLTPSGFQSFDGVKRDISRRYIEIVLDSRSIKVTPEHIFIDEYDEEIRANRLVVGDELSIYGGFDYIKDIRDNYLEADVYDCIEVADGHVYYTNGIVSHNCEMISSDACLVDSLVLNQMIHVETPIKQFKEIKIWSEFEDGKKYIMGVDPSTGSGSDYSVIEIFEFPSMIQVGEFRDNVTSTSELYRVIKSVIKMIEDSGAGLYWSVERNGIGEGLLALMDIDETLSEEAEFVTESNSKRPGFYTTQRTKIKSCLSLKDMITEGTVKIKSDILLTELKNYIRTRKGYEAKSGATDDAISALLIVVRILDEIMAFDDEAFDLMTKSLDDNYFADDDNSMGDYAPILL